MCTYLAHSKSNRAASFHVTIKLTPLFLFILLSIHCFIITESFLELEANMGIVENPIANRIHTYFSYVRTFHKAKQRSCNFSCYNSTNSFPSLFIAVSILPFGVENALFRNLVFKAFNSGQGSE